MPPSRNRTGGRPAQRRPWSGKRRPSGARQRETGIARLALRMLALLAVAVAVLLFVPGGALAPASPGGDPVVALQQAARSEVSVPAAPQKPERPAFRRPEHVRGIYVNAWSAGSRRRMAALLALADSTEINTFVVDVKDATGYVSHRSRVPEVVAAGATGQRRIGDMPGLLARLAEAGVYPVARIVVVKDPLLAAARPDLAVQDSSGGVWTDDKGVVWLNAYSREVWNYHVALAREVAEMGFPEIQWDYVRFPDAPRSALERARFPGRNGTKAQAIRAFLAHSRDALSDLDVQMTADVFGVTTSAYRDVGIGQVWESFIDVVDVALPMVYPSHYWPGSFGFDDPNGHPYEIVHAALAEALKRSGAVHGAGSTRPWLQDFTLGKPRYGAPEVRAQIQATYDAGIREWILWNPSSRYTEDALAPAGDPYSDPLMRVAGRVVPASQRWGALDSAAAARAAEKAEEEAAKKAADQAAKDTVPTGIDTLGAPAGAALPSYQEDLRTPGISPWRDMSRKAIRERPNLRMKPRGRPDIWHRLR